MANDTYTLNNGQVFAGLFNRITGIAEGGTVNTLATDVSASGFTLLSTAPATSIYRNSPHTGMAWDEQRKAAWIFGAETHSDAADYDNSVYCFDTSDGLFKKMYEQSPWPAEYNIDADGYLWADDAGTLPWAAHVYQRARYDAVTKELVIPYDTEFHSYTTPIQKGAIALADRKKPIWRFNTISKQWRVEHSPAIQSFVGAGTIYGCAYSDEYGYVQIPSPLFQRLNNEDSFSSVSISGISNSQYHDSVFFVDDQVYKFCGNDNTYLFSKHFITSPATAVRREVSFYSALIGWSITNKPAVAMPDGNVLFMATSGTDLGAFIYNTALDTVVDTGYRLSGFTQPATSYDFKLSWSAGLGGAVYLTRLFGTVRAYLLRL